METKSRRSALADAALEVLAKEGARGLTHRAVDLMAKVPAGTTSNYFRTREAMLDGLAQRIDERLRPDEVALALSAKARPSVQRMVTLMQELVHRVLAQPSLWIALLELRLEASRRPELKGALTKTLQRGLEADLTHHRDARLPGGRTEVVLLHLGIDGLLLNQLTTPDCLGLDDVDRAVATLTRRLMA